MYLEHVFPLKSAGGEEIGRVVLHLDTDWEWERAEEHEGGSFALRKVVAMSAEVTVLGNPFDLERVSGLVGDLRKQIDAAVAGLHSDSWPDLSRQEIAEAMGLE